MVWSGVDSTHSRMQDILSSSARRVQEVLNVTVSSCMLTHGCEALQPMLLFLYLLLFKQFVLTVIVCVCVCVCVLNRPLLPSTGSGGD